MFNVWPVLILLMLQGSCGAELSVRQVHLIAALVHGGSLADGATKRLTRSEIRVVFAERAVQVVDTPAPASRTSRDPGPDRPCREPIAGDLCDGFLTSGRSRDGPERA